MVLGGAGFAIGIATAVWGVAERKPALFIGVAMVAVSVAGLWAGLAVIYRLMQTDFWRARALRRGRCPNCNYDIRMHPRAGARCPECGEGLGRQMNAEEHG